jgi:hypothetical protein
LISIPALQYEARGPQPKNTIPLRITASYSPGRAGYGFPLIAVLLIALSFPQKRGIPVIPDNININNRYL